MTQIQQLAGRAFPAHLEKPVVALCRVAHALSSRISMGGLTGNFPGTAGTVVDGGARKAPDLIADAEFRAAVKHAGIRWYASKARGSAVEIDPAGGLALAIDPLDGFSDIDMNIPTGTIFSIQQAQDAPGATFLRAGRHIEAAGYFIYGPQTLLMVSLGDGLRKFILDREAGIFREFPAPPLPDRCEMGEFAINVSNYRHWSQPIRAYIDDCLAGIDGPHGKNFNMRWTASLVAETHRIILRGGIFLDPGDARIGHAEGRLRLVHECAPIAFLVEQSGGRATDGINRILDRVPASLHAPAPFVFGTPDKVGRVATYHDLPEPEVSALFGNRGLFRV
ncbi:class 1 fructose-bisphosphatase [Paracoccus methylarcula]|uniref:Fructose-1,6-bisphosphatase class 1 n=1 Tax=Paracoccus methylarcula TaxID=72022 RepID=A0A422QUC5_9RHOB|nr:class 1 fructose-bisphosphatase [Paracoccus methylarcula]RNF33647.1 fructose-1,6-bisphosphatase [Paracoccus methylarcula]